MKKKEKKNKKKKGRRARRIKVHTSTTLAGGLW
jgi:hypothetical protein